MDYRTMLSAIIEGGTTAAVGRSSSPAEPEVDASKTVFF